MAFKDARTFRRSTSFPLSSEKSKFSKVFRHLCRKAAQFQQSLDSGLLLLFAEIGKRAFARLLIQSLRIPGLPRTAQIPLRKDPALKQRQRLPPAQRLFPLHTWSSLSKSNLAKERSCEDFGSCKICVCTGAVGNSSGCTKDSYCPSQKLSVRLQVTV